MTQILVIIGTEWHMSCFERSFCKIAISASYAAYLCSDICLTGWHLRSEMMCMCDCKHEALCMCKGHRAATHVEW